jgi:hippurate hydrolase
MRSKGNTIIVLIFIMVIHSSVFAQISEKIKAVADQQIDPMFALCKDLHRHPELSLHEFETAKKMASILEEAGFEVTRNFGGNNVVGILRNGDGPVVMLRTDMDALPIKEETGFDFASTTKTKNKDGKELAVMHACGHDIHMSVWSGTINSLVALKNNWKGTLLVIAQHAEELGLGADLAIKKGLFRKFPTPDCALAYHINPELVSGTIGLVGGPVFAGVKTVNITVYGKGGHGAYPQKCIDPIVIASRIVLDLQTIVSRELSPLEPAVITVGSIHGGTRPNIIPNEVKMELTLRYYSDETLSKMLAAINRISKAAALAAGMPDNELPLVEVDPMKIPPVLNNQDLSSQIYAYASSIIGSGAIVETNPVMVGEDFGKYACTDEKIPICLIWLGSTSSELMNELKVSGKSPEPLHSPQLTPDYKKTIRTGIEVMTGNIIGLMNEDTK